MLAFIKKVCLSKSMPVNDFLSNFIMLIRNACGLGKMRNT